MIQPNLPLPYPFWLKGCAANKGVLNTLRCFSCTKSGGEPLDTVVVMYSSQWQCETMRLGRSIVILCALDVFGEYFGKQLGD